MKRTDHNLSTSSKATRAPSVKISSGKFELSAEMIERLNCLIHDDGQELVMALSSLGQKKQQRQKLEIRLDKHPRVSSGIPTQVHDELAQSVEPLTTNVFQDALVLTLRALKGQKGTKSVNMSTVRGERAFEVLMCVAHCIKVLGSACIAIEWLSSPAMGLERQTPIELLNTAAGSITVEELLGRIEFGVYC